MGLHNYPPGMNGTELDYMLQDQGMPECQECGKEVEREDDKLCAQCEEE